MLDPQNGKDRLLKLAEAGSGSGPTSNGHHHHGRTSPSGAKLSGKSKLRSKLSSSTSLSSGMASLYNHHFMMKSPSQSTKTSNSQDLSFTKNIEHLAKKNTKASKEKTGGVDSGPGLLSSTPIKGTSTNCDHSGESCQCSFHSNSPTPPKQIQSKKNVPRSSSASNCHRQATKTTSNPYEHINFDDLRISDGYHNSTQINKQTSRIPHHVNHARINLNNHPADQLEERHAAVPRSNIPVFRPNRSLNDSGSKFNSSSNSKDSTSSNSFSNTSTISSASNFVSDSISNQQRRINRFNDMFSNNMGIPSLNMQQNRDAAMNRFFQSNARNQQNGFKSNTTPIPSFVEDTRSNFQQRFQAMSDMFNDHRSSMFQQHNHHFRQSVREPFSCLDEDTFFNSPKRIFRNQADELTENELNSKFYNFLFSPEQSVFLKQSQRDFLNEMQQTVPKSTKSQSDQTNAQAPLARSNSLESLSSQFKLFPQNLKVKRNSEISLLSESNNNLSSVPNQQPPSPRITVNLFADADGKFSMNNFERTSLDHRHLHPNGHATKQMLDQLLPRHFSLERRKLSSGGRVDTLTRKSMKRTSRRSLRIKRPNSQPLSTSSDVNLHNISFDSDRSATTTTGTGEFDDSNEVCASSVCI